MKNTGLGRLENTTVDNFTSDAGIKIRKEINPIWRKLLIPFTSRKVILEQYPELNDDEQYIFVCNHSFDEDVISLLSKIDRNVYILNGSTDQTEHSVKFYAVWANGMIYVNRKNEESRSSAIDKMDRILKAGSSVMLFGEGGYNNSENQIIQNLFHSPYILAKKNNVKVVPMISFNEFGSDKIYIRAGEPIDLTQYEKYEAANILRENMASITYEILLDHTNIIKRKELYEHLIELIKKERERLNKKITREKERKIVSPSINEFKNVRECYMEMRRLVYECQEWYNNVWSEEATVYHGHGVTTPQQAIEYVDNVKVTAENANVLGPVLVKRKEDQRYNLIKYLEETIKLKK